jgi:hypothetical protein
VSRLFAVDHVLDSDAWYTPAWVFEGLGVTFDLDVASPEHGLPWLPAKAYYTAAEDGLLQPWHGLVWCNPPYSDPGPWCHRWAKHSDGCLLIKADLSTVGAHAAFGAATSMYVPSRRLDFLPGKELVGPPNKPNFAAVILGRGATADSALRRLESCAGGHARTLSRS